jgi:fatty-acyl-CoA synthase
MLADGVETSATNASGAETSATNASGAETSATNASGAETSATNASSDLDGWLRYPECVADQPDTPIDDEREGDLLQYSSGTTGRPKGIKRGLPHVSPAEAPGMMSALVDVWMDRDAVYLSPAPLYHTAPSVWSMTVQAAGITTVVMEKFGPEGALDAIQRYRVTHGQFVPAMFIRMLKLPESVRNSYDISSLKRVIHAAAPCPVEIKKQMIDWWGPIVDEYYASSEAIGSTLISAEEWLAHPGSVGKASLGNVHILDGNGNELGPGQAGEIYFEGGHTFEYLNDPAKTAASRDKNGWMTVGDVGYLDDDGYLFLTDRIKDMIVSGGENVYPIEVEEALSQHPAVAEVAVIGVPDDQWGESVKAIVVLRPGQQATGAQIIAFTRAHLAHYKCPRTVDIVEALPRTPSGKVLKRTLRTPYWAGRDRQI